MTTQVSDRLRDALERLDQTIDRLEVNVGALSLSDLEKPEGRAPDNARMTQHLDRMIDRIELALGK